MRKSKISRKKLAFWGLAVVIVFGLGYYFYGKISADTDLVPKTIPAGWSMIDGQSLNSLSLSKVLQSGVLIYSYNDPNTNNTGWTYATNNCQRFKSVSSMPCVDTLSLSPSLSYLTYNKYSPFTFPIVNFTKLSNYQNGYRSGWHILSWQESGTKRADFLKKISLKLANNSTASADYMIDRKYISSSIFQEDLSSQSIFQSFGFKDDASNVSRLTKGNAWMYFNGPDLTISQITSAPTSKGAFSFGLNVSPNSITPATNDGANFNQDATNLGATFIRYVNFDLYASTRQSDLDKANSLKDSGNELLGNLMPYGSSIANDRNSSILSSKGTKYSTSAEIDYDINLYSGVSPDGITPAQSPNWDKLKTLLIEEYFKAIVIRKNFVSDLPLVAVDPNQIRQVLLNLIINAGHAMPNGGELEI